MTDRRSDRRHVAYHEAGHAIAAEELDVQFGMITIVPNGYSAGGVGVEGDDGFSVEGDAFSPENEHAFQAWAEQQSIIDYAGHAAIVVLLGIGDMSHKSALANGASDDFIKARRRLNGNRRRMDRAKARAVDIITGRVKDVHTVADALLKHQTLDSQSVEMLLAWGTLTGPWGTSLQSP